MNKLFCGFDITFLLILPKQNIVFGRITTVTICQFSVLDRIQNHVFTTIYLRVEILIFSTVYDIGIISVWRHQYLLSYLIVIFIHQNGSNNIRKKS